MRDFASETKVPENLQNKIKEYVKNILDNQKAWFKRKNKIDKIYEYNKKLNIYGGELNIAHFAQEKTAILRNQNNELKKKIEKSLDNFPKEIYTSVVDDIKKTEDYKQVTNEKERVLNVITAANRRFKN